MRHQRKTVGLIATVCAFALAATPALAHEFVASKAGKISGKTEEGPNKEGLYEIGPNTQNLKFGALKIHCEKAAAKGAVAAGASKTFATAIKFGKCWTAARIGEEEQRDATRFLTELAIEYHANGFVETGTELEEVEGAAVLSGGEAEIKINMGIDGEFHKTTCILFWPEQTLPLKAEKKPEGEYSAATFSNVATPSTKLRAFPDGFQHSITVANAFKGIKYELEGERCEKLGKGGSEEGAGGQYAGSFPEILAGGNFEFS